MNSPNLTSGAASRQNRCGVIFDLDGTLADTLQDIAEGVNHALSANGLETFPPEQIKLWVGDGLPTLMRQAAPTADERLLARLVEDAQRYYVEHRHARSRLYPGVAETLAAIDEAGIPMAVLTNKPEPVASELVGRLCPQRRFVAVVGYRDEALKKPNPQVALQIAEQMSVRPDRVYFVGDSQIDIATAHNAGMKAVCVTWGFRPREDLVAAGADHIIDKPFDLLDLLCVPH